MTRSLSIRAKAYIATVMCAGATALALLVLRLHWLPGDAAPVALFSALSLLAPLLSISYRGSSPTRMTHQIGSSFAYPLLVLVDPGVVALLFVATTLADKWINGRRWLTTLFNVAQLILAATLAGAVRELIRPGRALAPDHATVLAAAAAILVFAATNHVLTRGVVTLVNGWRFFAWNWFTRTGLLTETLCIVSGLGMAVLWLVDPWLTVLGVVPIWTLFLLIATLTRREETLEAREKELRSLQTMGLEIGAELDIERLRQAALRVSCEGLSANRALLAMRDVDRGAAVVVAARGLARRPPVELALDGLDPSLFERGDARLARDEPAIAELGRELSALESPSLLVAPLEIHGRREGLLVLGHDARRHPFDGDDLGRLRTLVPFVEVALTNARLVSELREVQAQLAHSEKMSALGIMVSGVAHELNNPLTSVLGYAELLGGREPDERKRAMARRIVDEAKRAGRIVQNLLTFSRKRRPEKAPTDINRVVDDVLEFRAYELRVDNIEVVRRLSPDLPAVTVDPHQFHQVFLNLITNAAQAIAGARRPGRIIAESRLRGDQVQIDITDDGPGIRPEHLDQVFLPFFTTKEVGRGTGLGLSICYGIVEQHGGRIEVDSRPGAGATFTVTIPATPARAAGERAATATEATDAQPAAVIVPFRGRVLLVDDETSIVHLLTEALQPQGWVVHAARDGADALRAIADVDFDVVLLDLRMAGMDGITMFRRLEAERPQFARRVVFATGDASGERTAAFLASHANPVVTKPFDLAAVERAVNAVATRTMLERAERRDAR